MEVEEIDRYISIKKFFINIGNIVCINLYMVYSFIVYYWYKRIMRIVIRFNEFFCSNSLAEHF
jgi:hypothetical protein